ncbi:MAG: hypothetical protein A2X12_01760 [Bacteroidetes bacterium GWE2_29_8]|nr:MAG: hypothetical protein A2X12_01760 [Bacteroidetes bacterium GWE2_29_8]OFY17895.1 MAG: hypothetical protein A2X02_00510 [Bacteroidetes bacterium GWF2_29_10]
MTDVFINRISVFLPNNSVLNEDMETYLGLINGKSSKSRRIVLRNNGIENRYYALDKQGNVTHSNADLVASAIRKMFEYNPDEIKDIDLLVCGTSTPDQLLPSHAVMVHGLLAETSNIEVVSHAGACCAGMHSLKYAYLSIKSREKHKAVCSGSERVSPIMKSTYFEEEISKLNSLESEPFLAFEKDFLRWMLSDGAGAFLVENHKNTNSLSLKIEWIELSSFANKLPACMYMGADKAQDGSLRSYHTMKLQEILCNSVLSIKQDVKLLSENIVELGFNMLKSLLDTKHVNIESIDYFLPHISSFFFQEKIYNIMKDNHIGIPYEKWFTNLKTIGNVGSGSIYLMLDELFNSGKLQRGEKLLLVVPESARFSYAFCLLTVC